MRRPTPAQTVLRIVTLLLLAASRLQAHEPTRVTHEFERGHLAPDAPRLVLNVTDRDTGQPTPARVSVVVDGKQYEPAGVGPNGLRFVSIHQGKEQQRVVTYTRGTGPVEVQLPESARQVRVHVVKGLEYLPATAAGRVSEGRLRLNVALHRWSDIREDGWHPADEHLHYNRLDPADDGRWLTMLAGDDLSFAHFLILRGGNGGAGVWATQYAYGAEGRKTDGRRTIIPGEEYRDRKQGHMNLLGIEEVIEPISTGGQAPDAPRENYPPFHEVLKRTRQLNGLGGIAHGAKLGSHPTAVADSVLGAVDFWEISNGFINKTDLWYHLMSCGFVLPPAAGTDLPNYPSREPWQPFLGGVRMYVRIGERRDLTSWKRAVRAGRVFITSGPLLRFTVEGAGPGGTVRLPADGGKVTIRAELASPRPLQALEVVKNGRPVKTDVRKDMDKRVPAWRIETHIPIRQSCWLAARGEGSGIEGPYKKARAHTGAVRVLVGEQPITSRTSARSLVQLLCKQKAHYAERGRYEQPEHRRTVQRHFEKAIGVLERQLP